MMNNVHEHRESYVRAIMKRQRLTALLSLLGMILWGFSGSALADKTDQRYRLSSDDVISINVFGEPDLSLQSARIAADGTISMPLLGRINVKGRTIKDVDAIVTQMLLDGYLKKPSVSVTITEHRPFYIEGEVRNPGSYSFRRGLTVLQAVTLAGGFTERASKRSIYVEKEKSRDKRNKVSLNYRIAPGDIVTVNESFF